MRRHQSLTYGATHSGATGVKRSGTLAGVKPRRNNTIGLGSDANQGSGVPESPSPPEVEENFVEEDVEEEEYFQQQMSATSQTQAPSYSSSGRSPWSTPSRDWRGANSAGDTNNAAYNANGGSSAMDDVQRALSALELSSGASPRGTPQLMQVNNVSGPGQPPRFSGQLSPGLRGPVGSGLRTVDLRLVTDFNAQVAASSLYQSGQVQQSTGGQGYQGPFNATGFVPPIGHGAPSQQGGNRVSGSTTNIANAGGSRTGQTGIEQGQAGTGQSEDRAATVSGIIWDQKDRVVSNHSSNPNLQYQQQQANLGWSNSGGPPVPSLPAQYLQQQQAPRLGAMNNYGGGLGPQGNINSGQQSNSPGAPGYVGSPIDVPTLIATKGYNPTSFEIRPTFARYFVIKSYTEDDVHKSLKYEIWSSTDPGNKRLDKAFKECAGRGPIYLFFSVNARYVFRDPQLC